MKELQQIKRLMDEMDVIISNYAELTTDTSDHKKFEELCVQVKQMLFEQAQEGLHDYLFTPNA